MDSQKGILNIETKKATGSGCHFSNRKNDQLFLNRFTSLVFFMSLSCSLLAQGLHLRWAKAFSNPVGGAISKSIQVDQSGNVYTCGYFYGTVLFGTGSNSYTLNSEGEYDIFLAKYDHSGNCLFAKRIGGQGFDQASSIVLDQSNNIYITGCFESTTDFDPGTTVQNRTSLGGYDIFFAKYDSDGNYVYAYAISGGEDAEATSIALDGNNSVYITGYFMATHDFDPSAGTQILASSGYEDAFLAKYDGMGNYVYAKRIVAGLSSDQANALAIDSDLNVVVTGYFTNSADFDPGVGLATILSSGNRDIFIAKYDPMGNYLSAQGFGGINADQGVDIAIGSTGSIFITGFFQNTVDFDPGSTVSNLVSTGGKDIFLARYTPNGDLIYANAMGGANADDYAYALALSVNNDCYLTGVFAKQADFHPGIGTQCLTSKGLNDFFVAKYDSFGKYIYAHRFGAQGDDYSYDIAYTPGGKIYTTGQFHNDVDFDPSQNNALLSSAGINSTNAFTASFEEALAGQLQIKVFLQGALLNSSTPGLMRDDLRANNYLPINDPYSNAASPRFILAGAGLPTMTTNEVFTTRIGTPDAIVDWVFIELRSADDPTHVVETRAALLQRDGDVVSPEDGNSNLILGIDGYTYYVAVKHRNHLGVMTATPKAVAASTAYLLDFSTLTNEEVFNFTTPFNYNGLERVSIGSLKALWAGDANSNGRIKYQSIANDYSFGLSQVINHPGNTFRLPNFSNALGYYNGDTDLDGRLAYQGAGARDGLRIFVNLISFPLNTNSLYNYDLFLEQIPTAISPSPKN